MELPGQSLLRTTLLHTTLRLAAQGPRPASEVWERYADPALWSTWSPQIRKVDIGAAERIAPGLTGRVYSYAPVPVHFLVTAVDEPSRRWAWRVSLGPVTLELEHGVDAGAMRTVTWLALTGAAPIVYGYAPVAQLALRKLVG